MIMTTKLSKQEQFINLFLDKKDANFYIAGHAKIIEYTINETGFCLIVFMKRRSNPVEHTRYRDKTTRDLEVDKKRIFYTNQKKEEDKILEERKQQVKENFKVGAILYTSWGWEQTNIDFYQILEVKGSTVTLQEIKQHKTIQRDDSGKCVAMKDAFIGEKFKRRINKWGSVKITEYASASLYNGQELYYSSYY